MYLDRFSVIIFAYIFFVQNYNLRVGFRRFSPLSKVDNTENMCIKWMYISNPPREVLWLLIWMRDICLIAFFFGSLFPPKLQVFLRPIGARSTDRLLWTLKRSRDNPSPSFISLHMNFSTSSLYSVVFVVAFVFFQTVWLAELYGLLGSLQNAESVANRVIFFHAFYTRHMTRFQVLFLMRVLVTCIFFQSCFSQRLLVARLLIRLFPRLLWAILQPLSPAKIVNTMNLSKNRIQLFILSRRKFLILFWKSFFSAFFRTSFLSKPTGNVPVFICWIKSPNLLYFEEKQDSRFTRLRLETLFLLPMFQSVFFVCLWEFFFSKTNG